MTAVQRAEAWVKQVLSDHDSSHDWWHIARVRAMALRLAGEEGVASADDLLVIELAALLHDVCDHKYCKQPEEEWAALERFLASLPELSPRQRSDVLHVIQSMGFSEQLPSVANGSSGPDNDSGMEQQPEPQSRAAQQGADLQHPGQPQHPASLAHLLAVVQDADRLDAIGAVGVARCLTFGGARNRVLHNPGLPARQGLTKEEYRDKGVQQTTINHFHEKLLLLKDLMRTRAGRRIAEGRHAFMLSFLQQFEREWEASV